MASSRCVEVNKDVFDAEIRKRGLKYSELSDVIGVSKGYFKNIVGYSGSGRLPMTIVNSLEREFNLKRDDYSLEKHPYTESSSRGTRKKGSVYPDSSMQTSNSHISLDVDYDHIQSMIDKSVDKAVSELKLDYGELHKAIYGAVYQAVKKAYNEPIDIDNKKKIEASSTKRVNGRSVAV